MTSSLAHAQLNAFQNEYYQFKYAKQYRQSREEHDDGTEEKTRFRVAPKNQLDSNFEKSFSASFLETAAGRLCEPSVYHFALLFTAHTVA